jgi:hypothetical protein
VRLQELHAGVNPAPCGVPDGCGLVRKFDSNKVARLILETLSRDFESIEILAVNVAEDVDKDGQDLLHVEVVFEGDLKGDDALRVAGAARRIRPVLEKIDADLYPLLSFVSKVDYDRGHRKSAGH